MANYVRLFIVTIVFIHIVGYVFAEENVDYTSGQYSIKTPTVTVGEPQTISGWNQSGVANDFESAFEKAGYFVSTERDSSGKPSKITFSISKTLIDLGQAKPRSIKKDSLRLTVSSPTAMQFQISAVALSGLKSGDGRKIASTECDGFLSNCTLNQSASWNNPDRFGWGHTVSGLSAQTEFPNANYFRPFGDASQGQKPETIISPQYFLNPQQADVTIKAILPAGIQAGTFQAVVNFIATPSY